MTKTSKHRRRRLIALFFLLSLFSLCLFLSPDNYQPQNGNNDHDWQQVQAQTLSLPLASLILEKLPVKTKASHNGYSRAQFYSSWAKIDGCSLREIILKRDLEHLVLDGCSVLSGVLHDPYTGEHIYFQRGKKTSAAIHIEHVVALADAWEKGAQDISKKARHAFASDPLNLLSIGALVNIQKAGLDAAAWLPKNKFFRCQYVARQISIKYKYQLWLTSEEKSAMTKVLSRCPNEVAPGLNLD